MDQNGNGKDPKNTNGKQNGKADDKGLTKASPCWCGSGTPYEDCCYATDALLKALGREPARSRKD